MKKFSGAKVGRRGFLSGASCFAATGFLYAAGVNDSVVLKNGAEFSLGDLPQGLTASVKRGGEVRFLIEEDAASGKSWSVKYSQLEGRVSLEHRGSRVSVIVSKRVEVQTPMLLEFSYGEQGGKPVREMRCVIYTIPGEVADFRYPKNAQIESLRRECERRGIVLTDWHVHIRGGMTVEMAAERERDCGFIRQSAMENHGREWEIFDNARLREFAEDARRFSVGGRTLPVGIQVNDRDWFRQIDSVTRSKFDYILADTMIMGTLPNGRANRLWLVDKIDNPVEWMKDYFNHTMQVLGEPISILANPTYLPKPIAGMYDLLWTDDRIKAVIGKAKECGIALEIQAQSQFPTMRFLRMAKKMGAKFSFGTNNFDPAPKNLSCWLDAITGLDMNGDDIWS